MSSVVSQITSVSIFTQPLVQVQIKEKKSKLWVTGLFVGNSPVSGEFPSQKGQKRGKYFYLMTSSWTFAVYIYTCSVGVYDSAASAFDVDKHFFSVNVLHVNYAIFTDNAK